MKARIVSATEFKSKFVSILKQIEEDGGPVIITRRGRPVAVVGPIGKDAWKFPRGAWAHKIHIQGDIANLDSSQLWDVVRKVGR